MAYLKFLSLFQRNRHRRSKSENHANHNNLSSVLIESEVHTEADANPTNLRFETLASIGQPGNKVVKKINQCAEPLPSDGPFRASNASGSPGQAVRGRIGRDRPVTLAAGGRPFVRKRELFKLQKRGRFMLHINVLLIYVIVSEL